MRTVFSLNGLWQIGESSLPSETPPACDRTVPVPGLAKLATPPFAGLSAKEIPAWRSMEDRRTHKRDSRRDYFWYSRSFELSEISPVVRIRFAKAQFGVRVWLNGICLGDHTTCFSSAVFDATQAVLKGSNALLVRVGAHPEMLQASLPSGADQEKFLWTAGIYDDVELWCSGAPTITRIQVAPNFAKSTAVFEALVHNPTGVSMEWTPHVSIRVPDAKANTAEFNSVNSYRLSAGEFYTFRCELNIPDVRLWSPEDPFLYRAIFETGGDEETVRFGMRELRFDTVTRRAWLNGKIYYLRGTNITLHRFFEDDLCGTLPWDEAWIRRLLIEIPKRYHWNCMRWSIGPVPQRWYEIASEAGLIIENEFFIWRWDERWDMTQVREHIVRWMADCWNNACVGWWSLSNETHYLPSRALVEELRVVDLSRRAWNNGFNLPAGPHDPVDDHDYRIQARMPWHENGRQLWTDLDYEQSTGAKTHGSPHPSAHATVLNEYCWYWLHRDGTQTLLTDGAYNRFFLGATSEERRQLYAEFLAGETEHFRAHRNFAGVLHFTYLTCDHPFAYTGDLFQDVKKLEVFPCYDEVLQNAFHPLGIYLNFWRRRLESGPSTIDVSIINDDPIPCAGTLEVCLQDHNDVVISRYESPFRVLSLCQETIRFAALQWPNQNGNYRLTACAYSERGKVCSVRRFRWGPPLL
jgi:hypothetical protein